MISNLRNLQNQLEQISDANLIKKLLYDLKYRKDLKKRIKLKKKENERRARRNRNERS